MKSLYNKISRKTRTIYILFFFITIFGSVGLSYFISTSRLEKELIFANINLLSQVSKRMDMVLQEIDKESVNLIQDANLTAFMYDNYVGDRYWSLSQLSLKLNSLKLSNSNIHSIYLVSFINRSLLHEGSSTKIDDFSDIGWLKEAKDSKGHYKWMNTRKADISSPTIANQKNLITLIRSYPIATAFEYSSGTLAINIDEAKLYTIIREAKPQGSGHIFVTDPDNNILSHDDKTQMYQNINAQPYAGELLVHSLKSPEGHLRYTSGGQSFSVFYHTSSYNGWKYISIIPEMYMYKSLVYIRNTLLLIALSLSAIGIVLILAVNYRFIYPIDHFLDTVSEKLKAKNMTFASTSNKNTASNSFKDLEIIFDKIIKDNELMTNQIEESMAAMKWRLLLSILTGYCTDYSTVRNRLDLMNLQLHTRNFSVITIAFDDNPLTLEEKSNKDIVPHPSSLCSIAEKYINEESKGAAIELTDGKIVAIISFEESDAGQNQLKV